MKGFLKTWWHCLWRMFKGHRMCKIKYTNGKSEWMCSCSPFLKDIFK